MHFLLSLLSGFMGGLSTILFIIIIVVLLIVNWKIAIPLFLFVIYLSFAITRESKVGQWRFHTLWWIAQLIVIACILYGKQIIRIADHLLNDTNNFDHLAESYICDSPPYVSTYQLTNDTLISPNNNLYARLEVGMTPFAILPHIWEINDYDLFSVNGVYLSNFNRYYHHRRLYGISFSFSNYNDFSNADTLVHFLAKKYGPPHYEERQPTTYTARWQYRDKHMLIQAETESKGILYIYHPQILAQKAEEIARQRQQNLDELIRIEQEKKESIAKERADEERKIEERNRRLQDGL